MEGMYNPKKRLSARDFAYLEIKERIIKGDMTPNEPVIEESLSKELDISRTPLREALQRLEHEDLVVRQNNGRLKVAPLSVQEVKEIFDVRSKLESIAIVQATENAVETDIRKLSTIALMIRETYRDGNLDDILYYGTQFHNYIYELSNNQTVNKILAQLNDRIQRYRRFIPMDHAKRLIESEDEHQIILDYMENGDKAGAETAMAAHIQKSLESAVNAINNHDRKNV